MRLNLPNTLTVLRIFLAPLLVVVLLTPPWTTAWLSDRFQQSDSFGWIGDLALWLTRWREIVARYWGYVTMIDDMVGIIMDELEAQGCLDNTLVVFSTDHGDNMGAHRLIEKGPFTYEQCYRLPMIAAYPGCENPGGTSDEFVYLQDLYPTFLEIAGRTAPTEPDTKSFLAQMQGKDASMERDSIYAQFYAQLFKFEQRMIRTRTHKFVYNHSDIGELYDLENDPWEMTNLIDLPETKELQGELILKMREHMERVGDPILRQFDTIRHVY